MKNKRRILSILTIICCAICIAVMAVAYFLELEPWQEMFFQTAEELSLGIAAVLLIILAERKYYLGFRFGGVLPVFIIIGGLLVAVANFPFATLYTGEMVLAEDLSNLPIYIAYVLSIGLFEEMAFRGVVFNEILNKTKIGKKGLFLAIVITNVLFGLVHLLNLFTGGGIGATLLQVTYTFLIGCMCNIVMLFTGSLYWAVLLHAVFDFGGLLTSSGMAYGAPWNIPGAIIMATVGVLVTAFYVIAFFKDKNIVMKAYNR